MYQSSLNNKFPTCPPEAARSLNSWRKICNCCWRPSKVKPSPVSAPATTWELSFPSQTMGSSNDGKMNQKIMWSIVLDILHLGMCFSSGFFSCIFIWSLTFDELKKTKKNIEIAWNLCAFHNSVPAYCEPMASTAKSKSTNCFSPSLPFPCTQALDSSNWSTWTANHKVSWQSPQYFKSNLACAKTKTSQVSHGYKKWQKWFVMIVLCKCFASIFRPHLPLDVCHSHAMQGIFQLHLQCL